MKNVVTILSLLSITLGQALAQLSDLAPVDKLTSAMAAAGMPLAPNMGWERQQVVGFGSLTIDLKKYTGFDVIVTQPGETTINFVGKHVPGKQMILLVSYDQGSESCNIKMNGHSLKFEGGELSPSKITGAWIQNYWLYRIYDNGADWLISRGVNYY